MNAFASGGHLPAAARGSTVRGLMAGWDWLATWAHLGGVADITDHKAAAAGLPPVDSLSETRAASTHAFVEPTPPSRMSCITTSQGNRAELIEVICMLDMWPMISGANGTSPRTEVVVGSNVGGDETGRTSGVGHRARSHCRSVLPLVHFIPDSLTYSVP